MNKLLAGFLAGVVATAPMTMTMSVLHRLLPTDERYPLPPYEITMRAAADAHMAHEVDDPQKRSWLTLLTHFTFGGVAGGLYSLAGRQLPLPSGLKGALCGLAVWSVSYLAVLPALGLYRPPNREPVRRLALMAGAHFVWGPTMAFLLERLAPRD
jgi:uncharacterized membrane protein YagU involved in acid resistance